MVVDDLKRSKGLCLEGSPMGELADAACLARAARSLRYGAR